MIIAKFVRDKNGFIRKFTIEGHAGQNAKGKDIVCAAVSAVAYTAVGALEQLAGIGGFTEQDGFMQCKVPDAVEQEAACRARIILETMAIGLKQIEYSYKKYVSVLDEEVHSDD